MLVGITSVNPVWRIRSLAPLAVPLQAIKHQAPYYNMTSLYKGLRVVFLPLTLNP